MGSASGRPYLPLPERDHVHIFIVNVFPFQQDFAIDSCTWNRVVHTIQTTQKCGLATTGWTNERGHFAWFYLDVDVRKRFEIAVIKIKVLHGENRLNFRHASDFIMSTTCSKLSAIIRPNEAFHSDRDHATCLHIYYIVRLRFIRGDLVRFSSSVYRKQRLRHDGQPRPWVGGEISERAYGSPYIGNRRRVGNWNRLAPQQNSGYCEFVPQN